MSKYVWPHEPPILFNVFHRTYAFALKEWAEQDYDEYIIAWIMKHQDIDREHPLMRYAYELAELLSDEHMRRRGNDYRRGESSTSMSSAKLYKAQRMWAAQSAYTYKEILKGS